MTRAPFEAELMHGFVSRISEMNALAEGSAGFVWRFTSAPGDHSYLEPFRGYFTPFAPERILFNMSVWDSPEALKQYVYRSTHRELLKGKHQWVETAERPHLALWWVPAGEVPTVSQAREKLDLLHSHGPTAAAFTFARLFEAR